MGNHNHNNNEEEEEKTTKKNVVIKYTENKNNYKCIFHFSLFKNDCINSLDIINDKIVVGTIMGDVNLLRVDKNNLLVKKREKEKVMDSKNISQIDSNLIANTENLNKTVKSDNIKEDNKIKCIELKSNNNNNLYLDNTNNNPVESKEKKKIDLKKILKDKKLVERKYNNESQSFEKTNDKTKEKTRNKVIQMIKLNDKYIDISHQIIKKNKTNTNEKYIRIKKIMAQKKNDEEKNENDNENDDIFIRSENSNTNFNNLKSKTLEEDNSKTNLNDNNTLNKNMPFNYIQKFPQITKLIHNSNENIPCLEFDTEDKINISIGDFEVLCMEDMYEFNMLDHNSEYHYTKIKNYKNDSQHIKYCEHCTCMMKNSYYLIIYTQFAQFNSVLKFSNYKYKNRSLKTFKIKSGRIEMSNYSVPFDFDGDRFLFLDYSSKETRKICIYYTLTEKEMYEYSIPKDYGHISHMKLIYNEDNKIFLCRNSNQCEIHLLDDNFTCIESWKHIGNDAISSFVYINESKITDEFKNKLNSKIKNNNDNETDYDNYIMKNNNKTVKFQGSNNINKLNKNKKNIKLEVIQGASTLLNINNNSFISSTNNMKINMDYLNFGYNHTENVRKYPGKKKFETAFSFPERSSRRELNNSDRYIQKLKNEKVEGIEIYSIKKLAKPKLKKKYNNKNNERKNNDNNYGDINKEINNNTIDENESYNMNNNNINNYYILTLDKNGNINMYKEHKVKKICNLYEINNIDEKFKVTQFFSVGYPYYIIMNEFYIGITTDHGLFVIANDKDE